MFGCGQTKSTLNQDTTISNYGSFFRIENDGTRKFFFALGSGSVATSCQGITFDEENLLATILIQTSNPIINSVGSPSGSVDSYIMIVDSNGQVTQGKQVTFSPTSGAATYSQTLAFNGLINYNGFYIYAGTTTGYSTKLQQTIGKSGSTNVYGFNVNGGTTTYNNVFLMKYKFDINNAQRCLIDSFIDINKASDFITKVSNDQWAQVDSSNLNYQSTKATILVKSSFFAAYQSPYSGAFDLLDTMYIPKPCAYKSVNLTQLNYFYGQFASTYNIQNENQGKVLS